MNFEKEGLNIAKIKHIDGLKSFEEVPIWITDNKKVIKTISTFESIKIPDDNQDTEVMQQMPYMDKQNGNTRQILYVSGASGSGKSYYTSNYIKEYTKLFPKNKIILFSSVNKDEKLDKFKKLIRVKLNEEFYNTQLTIEDFRDCLVVYDDTEKISNIMIAEKLNNILNLLLTTGRHTNTSIIVTSHNTNNGHKTKLILLEAHSITLFLKSIGGRALKYVLETTFGLDKNQIDKIKQLPSRWVTIIKTYPMTVLYESGIYTLNKL